MAVEVVLSPDVSSTRRARVDDFIARLCASVAGTSNLESRRVSLVVMSCRRTRKASKIGTTVSKDGLGEKTERR